MQTLFITHPNGATERVLVRCGAEPNARRLPAMIGRALAAGSTAVLEYDGQARTAIERRGRWYMRLARNVAASPPAVQKTAVIIPFRAKDRA